MSRQQAKRDFLDIATRVISDLNQLHDLAPDIEMDGISQSTVMRNISVADGHLQAAIDGVTEATDE